MQQAAALARTFGSDESAPCRTLDRLRLLDARDTRVDDQVLCAQGGARVQLPTAAGALRTTADGSWTRGQGWEPLAATWANPNDDDDADADGDADAAVRESRVPA
ncbi:hypothetical protein [Kineococcus sp. SYSU DK005]|uniref:hypothetical protein n=1 Tax=Kineococcus sp. SYSU DK005 TaxID=3383126 RepID=UPI003D7D1967